MNETVAQSASIVDRKELMVQIQKAAKRAGLTLDRSTSCFCSVRCVCSATKGDFLEDTSMKLLNAMDREATAPEDTLDAPGVDYYLSKKHLMEEEFIRLKSAASHISEGNSASRLAEMKREEMEAAERERLQAIEDEQALRKMEQEDEEKRQKLTKSLKMKTNEIELMENALTEMVKTNSERAKSFDQMMLERQQLKEMLQYLVKLYQRQLMQELADLQAAQTQEMLDFAEDRNQQILDAQKALQELSAALKNMEFDSVDELEEKLKAQLAAIRALLKAAQLDFDDLFSALGSGLPCTNSLQCTIGEQCLMKKCFFTKEGYVYQNTEM